MIKRLICAGFITLIAAIACGTEEAGQTYYACWDRGSAVEQALGLDPHVPRDGDRNWHWCYKQDFIDAGWQPAPGHSPVEWVPPPPRRP